MKKTLFLTLSLLGCLYTRFSSQAQVFIVDTGSIFNQDSIDTQRIKVQYEMTYLQDTVSENAKPSQETLMLEIGKQYSKCYSYNFYVRDSLLIADAQAGASKETMLQHAAAIGDSQSLTRYSSITQQAKSPRSTVWQPPISCVRKKKKCRNGRFSLIRPLFFLIPAKRLPAALKAEIILPGTRWKFPSQKGPGNCTDCRD